MVRNVSKSGSVGAERLGVIENRRPSVALACTAADYPASQIKFLDKVPRDARRDVCWRQAVRPVPAARAGACGFVLPQDFAPFVIGICGHSRYLAGRYSAPERAESNRGMRGGNDATRATIGCIRRAALPATPIAPRRRPIGFAPFGIRNGDPVIAKL